MKDLVIGDVVILKTGGPRMTVVSINKKNKCKCAFFVDTALHYSKVPMASLENVTGVDYDESDVIPEKLDTFIDQLKVKEDLQASELVDDASMTILTAYIKEDQPLVLARLENSAVTFQIKTDRELDSDISTSTDSQ